MPFVYVISGARWVGGGTIYNPPVCDVRHYLVGSSYSRSPFYLSKILLLGLFYVHDCSAFMCLCGVCMPGAHEGQKEGIGCSGNGVRNCCELPHGCIRTFSS